MNATKPRDRTRAREILVSRRARQAQQLREQLQRLEAEGQGVLALPERGAGWPVVAELVQVFD